MQDKIENILVEMVNRASERFNLGFEDALAAVCHSKVANDLASNGNLRHRSIDALCSELFDAISKGN